LDDQHVQTAAKIVAHEVTPDLPVLDLGGDLGGDDEVQVPSTIGELDVNVDITLECGACFLMPMLGQLSVDLRQIGNGGGLSDG
jgi:hypothetical protein